jgi:WhiB family redox-sensing transcriptional regulator
VTRRTASDDSTSWRAQAACRHHDPGIFFPIGKSGRALADIGQAKAVCAACPVRSPCLSFALDTRQDYGVWGGYDQDERRALSRQRRRHMT